MSPRLSGRRLPGPAEVHLPSAGGGKRFDMLAAAADVRSLRPLNVRAATPEEIHRTASGTGSGMATIYIRVKVARLTPAGEACVQSPADWRVLARRRFTNDR